MKQPEYAAGVTSVYRKYLDLYEKDPAHFKVSQTDLQLLSDLYNREGFTDGYFHRHNGPEMMAVNLNGDEAKTPRGVRSIYDDMHRLYVENEKQLPAAGSCLLKAGRKISISVSSGDFQAEAVGDPAEEARKQPLTKERIREQLLKTGGSDFYFSRMEVDTDEKSFVPVSLLNQLRREALENLRSSMMRDQILSSPYNKRQDSQAQYVVRGNIESADGKVLATTQVASDGTVQRVYPYSNVFAHAVGYASNGKSGLESSANYDLLTSHISFIQHIMNEFNNTKDPGDTVTTTLDTNLQQAAYNALGDYRGAVIVMLRSAVHFDLDSLNIGFPHTVRSSM